MKIIQTSINLQSQLFMQTCSTPTNKSLIKERQLSYEISLINIKSQNGNSHSEECTDCLQLLAV